MLDAFANMRNAIQRWIYGPPEEPIPLPEPAYNPEHEPPPLDDVIQRGMAAVRLIGDPTMVEAFNAIEAEAFNTWVKSKRDELEKREEAYRIFQVIGMVRQKLIHYRDAARLRQDLRQGDEAA